jgi:hypothetical protein
MVHHVFVIEMPSCGHHVNTIGVLGALVGRQSSQMPLREHTMSAIQSMSRDELLAYVTRLQTANQRKVSLKVSEKGAISLYGLGRFPVTLYASQWERLLQEVDHVRDFIKDNEALLSRKE